MAIGYNVSYAYREITREIEKAKYPRYSLSIAPPIRRRLCNLFRFHHSIINGAMRMLEALEKSKAEAWSDEQVVERVRAGDTALYELLMRRYNQRLYRVARAILRDDAEAEDVMQDAFVRAYQNLHQFAARGPFSAWLTRIAVHEGLSRLRSRNFDEPLEERGELDGGAIVNVAAPALNPEQNASRAELGQLLEAALLDLPAQYRVVVMLRDVEELTTSETAAALDLTEQNVKVRLHRGHAMARNWLYNHVGGNAKNAFPFMGDRCDHVVSVVLARLAALRSADIEL
jgi:RNA polymerase sigma-70 factor (ECF subfamily)